MADDKQKEQNNTEEEKNLEETEANVTEEIEKEVPEEDPIVEEEIVVEEDLSEPIEETVDLDESAKKEIAEFRVGDTVKMQYRIIEGEKTRIQPFQGIVISKKGEGMSKTFTLRRIGANNVGIERIIPLNSPNIQKLEVVKKGKVRRAKLYYLRDKKGKAAMRIKERK